MTMGDFAWLDPKLELARMADMFLHRLLVYIFKLLLVLKHCRIELAIKVGMHISQLPGMVKQWDPPGLDGGSK